MLVLHRCKSKAKFKNVATGIKKENLLLTHYSDISPALKEVKSVARIFSNYFDNNKLKNETKELPKNLTTGCNVFWRSHLLIMWEITIFALYKSSSLFKNFLFKKWSISKIYLKVCNVSYNFSSEERSYRYFKLL